MNRSEMLTPKEEEIMCLIWDKNAPMTTVEISEYMEERGWSRVTVFKTIQSMTEKGHLRVAGFEKNAKAYARTFVPTLTKNEYFSDLLRKRGFSGESVVGLVTALLGVKGGSKREKNMEEAIKKMEKIVEEIKKEDALANCMNEGKRESND